MRKTYSWLGLLGIIMLTVTPTTLAQCPGSCEGDLNGDGCVDLSDLATLLARYGVYCDQAWTPDNDTVALWYLNGSGDDYSGNGNHLEIKTDRIGWVDDAPHCRGVLMGVDPWEGGCDSSDGAALMAPGPTCAYPGSGDWTVEAWVYFPSNADYYEIVTHYSQHIAGRDPYKLTIEGGVAQFAIQNSANDTAVSSADISALRGQWIHLAGIYRYEQEVALYVDLELVALQPTDVVPETLTDYDVYLGGSYCGTTTGLKIDEVRISDVDRIPPYCTGFIPLECAPSSATVNADGSAVYASCHYAGVVNEISTKSCEVSDTYGAAGNANGVTTNSAGDRLYVTSNANTLEIIDLTINTTICTVGVGNTPVSVALSPDERRAYVSSHISNTLSIVNVDESDETGFCTVVDTITVGTSQSGGEVVVSPDGGTVYVASGSGANQIAVISADTENDVYSLICTSPSIPGFGGFLVSSPLRARLYGLRTSSDELVVIDTTDPCNSDLWQYVPVGDGPKGIAVSPDESRIYIACENSNEVYVVDADTLTVIDQFVVCDNPQRVMCHPAYPDGSLLYVTCPGSQGVLAIDISAE